MTRSLVVYALVGAVLGGVATAIACSVLGRLSVLDVPNERSSHVSPVVRGGGIGFGIVWLACSTVVLITAGQHLAGGYVLLLMVLSLGVLGFADDVRHLPAKARLAAQVVFCAAAVAGGVRIDSIALPIVGNVRLGVAASLVSLAVLVSAVNLFNFMDGIDGLAAAQSATSALVLAIICAIAGVGTLALVCIALAGSLVGFLPFNWAPARCFMGDVGSYVCGAALGGLWLLGQRNGVPLAIAALPAAVFLGDATVTLLVRTVSGQAPWRPHRSHVYQRLVAAGWSHRRVTTLYAGSACVLGVCSIALARSGYGMS